MVICGSRYRPAKDLRTDGRTDGQSRAVPRPARLQTQVKMTPGAILVVPEGDSSNILDGLDGPYMVSYT